MKKSKAFAVSIPLITAFLLSACSSAEDTKTDVTNDFDYSANEPTQAVLTTTEAVTKATVSEETKAMETAEITAEETTPKTAEATVEAKETTTAAEIITVAEKKTTAAEVTVTTTVEEAFIHEDDEDWAVYVIGNSNPLPENYIPITKSISGERLLDIRCADYAIQMLRDASMQGVGLFVTSSYRSIETQRINLENYTNRLISKGYSVEEATAKAQSEIALPGHSEHNAGLAMDIVSDDYWNYHSDLEQSFDQLPQYDWLIENSWKYGFVLSYPKGKEDITGFIYEPWHYRFVGLKHAEKIHEVYVKTGEFLTVNEYVEEYMD